MNLMVLVSIAVATLVAGVGSVWIAAALSFGRLAHYTQYLLSFAAGALLATAFIHMLPEAFSSSVSPDRLFGWLLGGLIFFFLLDKAELWHHGHEHHHAESASGTPHEYAAKSSNLVGGWSVLAGDSVQAFGDGLLIASAFIASLELGILTALAVLAHEVPHHMGDLTVLRQTSGTRRMAMMKVSSAGVVTTVGGLAGFWLVDLLRPWLPYFLVLAASSFIYVALADLIPQLQRRIDARQTVAQIVSLACGIGLVLVAGLAETSH